MPGRFARGLVRDRLPLDAAGGFGVRATFSGDGRGLHAEGRQRGRGERAISSRGDATGGAFDGLTGLGEDVSFEAFGLGAHMGGGRAFAGVAGSTKTRWR